jgi:hypothetical protein
VIISGEDDFGIGLSIYAMCFDIHNKSLQNNTFTLQKFNKRALNISQSGPTILFIGEHTENVATDKRRIKMKLEHPCIKNVHVTNIKNNRFSPVKTLVIETSLAMPRIGEPCQDERLNDLLEYLEAVKAESKSEFGDFEAIEIRGSDMPAHKGNFSHLARRQPPSAHAGAVRH